MIPTIFISPSYYIANRHKKTLVEIKFNFLLTQFLGFLNYSRRHFRDYVTGYFRSHVDTFPYLCARCVAIKLPGCVINTRLKVISSAPRLAVQRLLILFFFFFFAPALFIHRFLAISLGLLVSTEGPRPTWSQEMHFKCRRRHK